MTNTADIGKIGAKFIGISSLLMLVASIMSAAIGFLLFQEPMPEFAQNTGTVNEIQFSIIETLVGIVPNNIIEPFKGNNIMQILFIAISAQIKKFKI